MSFFGRLSRKGAYHVLHPFLRFWRIHVVTPRDSARILLTYNNEILLVRHIGVRRWSLPGGALEKGETPEQAALRELKEELSITDATLAYKLGAYHWNYRSKQVFVHVFVARATSFYHKKQWELDKAGWFLLGKLPPNLSSATARRIGDYKNGLRDTTNFW